MHDRPRPSLLFPYHLPWDEARAVVQDAESAGLDGVWAYENPGDRGAFVVLGALLGCTRRLRVGVGVVRTYARHAQTTAMEAAQAAVIGGDRVVIGIGAGAAADAAALGVPFDRPLAALRETARAIRAHNLPGLAQRPLVYIGGMGPRVLELAGASADGVVVTLHAPPAFVAQCAAAVRAAARRARNDCAVVAYAHVVLADSDAEALERAKVELAPTLARVGDVPAFQRLYAAAGLDAASTLAAVRAVRAGEDPRRAVPDALASSLCLVTTPARLGSAIGAYADAGADEVALTSPSMTPGEYRELFAALS